MAGPAGVPDQTVESLIWIRARPVPPKTIAPILPLPTGAASAQVAAGAGQLSTRSLECMAVSSNRGVGPVT